MVPTRKIRQSKRGLLSEFEEFEQKYIIGNTVCERRANTIVNEGTSDLDFNVGTSGSNLMNTENTLNVKTLENVLLKGLTWKRVKMLTRLKQNPKRKFDHY